MKKKHKLHIPAVLLLCLTLVFPVHAGTSGTRQKITSANDRLSKLEQSRSDLKTYMTELNKQLSELSDTLNDLDVQQAAKEEEIEQTQEDLEAAHEKEASQYASMKLRIQFMFENGDLDLLSIIFGSESVSDMLNKLDFVQQITDYDRNMLIDYQTTKDTIAGKEVQLQTEMDELSRLHAQTAEQQQTVSDMLQAASSELKGFDTDISSAQKQLADYEAELKAQEDAIREKEEKAQAAENLNGQKDVAKNDTSENKTDKDNPGSSGSTSKPDTGSGDKDNGTQGGSDNGSSGTPSPGSYTDLELMAAIIECEAGGESAEGKVAVGSVVMNRVASSRYPNTILGVLYQSGQFSPVASGRFGVVLARGANSACKAAASQALAGEKPVGGCLYFRTIQSAQNAGMDVESMTVIGNHVFF